MHSILSDGKNTYDEMIQSAIKKGLDEVGLSDHLCLRPVTWALKPEDIFRMAEEIERLKERYMDQITVRFGIEMDYLEGMEEEIKGAIESLPLDYVIGSVHFIGDWNFDTDKSQYSKWTNDQVYEMYYANVKKAAQSGLFDIIGHLDIIKKFQIYPESDQSRLVDETLQIIKAKNLVVELNTGGLDRPCADFTPSAAIIERCFQYQIPVTISSDAHRTDQVGRHFNEAHALLKDIGYAELARFENRRRSFFKL